MAPARATPRGALSEINVTPLVDVMLVLLIIFMVSAPLLTVGVPVELPKTEAGAMEDQSEPLTVSIRADGAIYHPGRGGARSPPWRRACGPWPATRPTSRSSSAPTAGRPTPSWPR